MGLGVRDFDVVTLKQFRVMQRRFRENFEYEKELESHVVNTAMYNFNRKKGIKYEKVFPEKVKELTIEKLEEDTEELFG